MKIYDTIVIGGGQAGLSVAYFLRRAKLDYLVLDDREKAGGAWLQTWDSLQLFSPTEYSSLSGWAMPKSKEEYPHKNEFIAYLTQYEARYNIPVQRNTKVLNINKEEEVFKITTNQGIFYSKTLVSATGTSQHPFIPNYTNSQQYKGIQLHSVNYKNEKDFEGKKVLVVGGGNSGAQILAEVSKVAKTKWVTLEEPFFLPEEIDGRYLFNEATKKFYGTSSSLAKERSAKNVSLSNIVQVASVKEGRKRNVFKAVRPFTSFYEEGVLWENGEREAFDAVIWCTGFKANLNHLEKLNVIEINNRISTNYTRSVKEPNLWLVGYGSWTGFASATIYGVGKTARHTVNEIKEAL